MREELKEAETIATNTEKADVREHDRGAGATGRLLDRAERTFSNLNACDTNPKLQKIDKEMAPKLAAHHDAIFLNPKLFARVQALYEQARQARARSGIGLSARALLQGFRARGSQAVRCRQGEAEEDQCRTRHAADAVRTKRPEGKKRVVGCGR